MISTVALAGQIIEEHSAKRFGLDMEIEFKDDDGKPTTKGNLLIFRSHCRRERAEQVRTPALARQGERE